MPFAFIRGTASADTLYGAAVRDWITGLAGNDSLWGEDGDDTIHVLDLQGVDYADGGTGTNIAADFDLDLDTLLNF
jgi:Ca2+-binding RTX toxin-like protein